MDLGDRLRALREERKPSQGAIEKRTGLLRCYISRVANGHTVPSLQTLEKLTRALELPLYRLFYDGKVHPTSQSCSDAKPKPTLPGAPLEETRGFCHSYDVVSAAWMTLIESC